MVTTANILQSCIPLLSLSAYVPQWRKLALTKSSRDISLGAWLMWSMTASMSTFYAVIQYLVSGNGLPLVFSTVTSLTFILVTVYLIVWHRREGSAKGAVAS
jgi:uncharacterized protein with PQ loop repeat